MPVILNDSTAWKIARLLEQFDSAMESEYNTGEPDARHLAEKLRNRAGPPRDPIRQWVEDHRESLDLETEEAVELATDKILLAIERHGHHGDRM